MYLFILCKKEIQYHRFPFKTSSNVTKEEFFFGLFLMGSLDSLKPEKRLVLTHCFSLIFLIRLNSTLLAQGNLNPEKQDEN